MNPDMKFKKGEDNLSSNLSMSHSQPARSFGRDASATAGQVLKD